MNSKDSVLNPKTRSHRFADLFSGTFFCFLGLLSFLPLASVVHFKPQTSGETVRGTLGFVIVFSFAATLLLVGLRYLFGPEGVKIDANQKAVYIWRRNFWLKTTESLFPFEQLKRIKIEVRRKPGVFGHGFNVYSVIAGEEPGEVELYSFSTIAEAKALAKRAAEFSGLQFLE